MSTPVFICQPAGYVLHVIPSEDDFFWKAISDRRKPFREIALEAWEWRNKNKLWYTLQGAHWLVIWRINKALGNACLPVACACFAWWNQCCYSSSILKRTFICTAVILVMCVTYMTTNTSDLEGNMSLNCRSPEPGNFLSLQNESPCLQGLLPLI